MAVVKVKNGVVVQTWRDVETIAQAVAKYGLDPVNLVEGDHASGTKWDGTTFTAPVPSAVSELESPVVLALRDLADAISPAAVAKIVARFGPR